MRDSSHVDALATIIWEYHQMHQPLAPADAIVVLGSHDPRVAERGAELWHEGWAPLLVFSGGLGNFTKGVWTETEADTFAKIARAAGVPDDSMLIENTSTNTGENIRNTQALFAQHNIHPRTLIVVQKPYMERRAFASFRKAWPEVDVIVTSPQISYEAYPTKNIPKDDLINILVGDLQRIKAYSSNGFQIPQDIPPNVWDAYEQLVALGYTKHLLAKDPH